MTIRFAFWMLREQKQHLSSVLLKLYAFGETLLPAGYFILNKMSMETFGLCQNANPLSCHNIVFKVMDIEFIHQFFNYLKCYT